MTRSTSLFALPKFIRGMAAALDLGSTLTVYNVSKSGYEADLKALKSDWVAVGEDLYFAMNKWDHENCEQSQK